MELKKTYMNNITIINKNQKLIIILEKAIKIKINFYNKIYKLKR